MIFIAGRWQLALTYIQLARRKINPRTMMVSEFYTYYWDYRSKYVFTSVGPAAPDTPPDTPPLDTLQSLHPPETRDSPAASTPMSCNQITLTNGAQALHHTDSNTIGVGDCLSARPNPAYHNDNSPDTATRPNLARKEPHSVNAQAEAWCL
jgi:hypothetical protein